MTEKKHCSVLVPSAYSFRGYLCTKPARVEEDGKWVCSIHSTAGVTRRALAAQAKWEARRRRQDRRNAIAAARIRVAEQAKLCFLDKANTLWPNVAKLIELENDQ